MIKYKLDPLAFLYLDPPYNSKNTSTESYIAMSGEYHNYLLFIQEFINDPTTKCRVMLNVDFTGDVYCRFKDNIKHHYPVRYSAQTSINDKSKPPIYHTIILNY
jgi:site-specific DNA-adenine methylase